MMIKYIWQLPQNLLGLLLIRITKADNYLRVYKATRFKSGWSGVSLGKYIIFSDYWNFKDLRHEEGHQQQSLYLGPLYLLLIGLPSLIGNLLHRVIKFDYYRQPWEKWADKLGGVER